MKFSTQVKLCFTEAKRVSPKCRGQCPGRSVITSHSEISSHSDFTHLGGYHPSLTDIILGTASLPEGPFRRTVGDASPYKCYIIDSGVSAYNRGTYSEGNLHSKSIWVGV